MRLKRMHWIAPSTKNALTEALENRFWGSADQLRANSGFKAQEYFAPIFGIIFLRFAAQRTKLSEQIIVLKCQIQNLRRTRGLLLLPLLSGQVEFKMEVA